MNSWQINWTLSISKQEAINILHSIIQSHGAEKSRSHKYKGNISKDSFELEVKRPLAWGTAIRKEIKGKGTVADQGDGSRLSAEFEICAPFKYVDLNTKKLSIILPVFILTWIGLFMIMLYPEKFEFLFYIIFPAFFITCFILITGFFKYISINDKFEKLRKTFQGTFYDYIADKS